MPGAAAPTAAHWAEWLRRARLRAGLTQEELSVRSGVAVRTIGDWERRRIRRPHRRTVELLAPALGLATDDLQAVRRNLVGPPDLPWEVGRPERPDAGPREKQDHRASRLPAGVSAFVGRAKEMTLLAATLSSPPEFASSAGCHLRRARPLLLSGPPGMGKTALALHVGSMVAERYPQGQFLLDGGGSTTALVPGEALLAQVLRLLGADSSLPGSPGEREALYGHLSCRRSMLLVLDDVAQESQVRPFLGGGLPIVLTSRRMLSGLGPDIERLVLPGLGAPEAVALIEAAIGRQRVAEELDAVLELVHLGEYHPLALTAVAGRLATRPGWPIAALVARLRDEGGRLARLELADLSVRGRLHTAYCGLDTHIGPLFSRLALLGCETLTPRQVAAALLGGDEVQAEKLLDELTDAGLLIATSSPQEYRMPVLHRLFATEIQNEAVRGGSNSSLRGWTPKASILPVTGPPNGD